MGKASHHTAAGNLLVVPHSVKQIRSAILIHRKLKEKAVGFGEGVFPSVVMRWDREVVTFLLGALGLQFHHLLGGI